MSILYHFVMKIHHLKKAKEHCNDEDHKINEKHLNLAGYHSTKIYWRFN